MPKTTTIDHTSVLEMALVGYEMQRNRIEAAIAEIQDELGQGDSSRSGSTATASTEPKTPRKKRFSAAARKRMAAAQKKRWQLLKAKKALAKKAKPTAPVKRQKATAAAPARTRPVKVKAATKLARNVVEPVSRAKKMSPKPKESAAMAPKATVETPATPVQVATEPTPATA
jgi:hypothetical protein